MILNSSAEYFGLLPIKLCGLNISFISILPSHILTGVYINSLEQLTDEQLPAIIDLYTVVSSQYKMNILQTHTDGNNDNFISLGEIYEEMLKRPTKHM